MFRNLGGVQLSPAIFGNLGGPARKNERGQLSRKNARFAGGRSGRIQDPRIHSSRTVGEPRSYTWRSAWRLASLIDAPDLAMDIVVAPSRCPESADDSPRLACQTALPGVSSGGYGAFQRARDGRDGVHHLRRDVPHRGRHLRDGLHLPAMNPSHMGSPALQQATDEQASRSPTTPSLSSVHHCCCYLRFIIAAARVCIITAAARVRACMVLLIVCSPEFSLSPTSKFSKKFCCFDGALHKSSRLKTFAKFGRILSKKRNEILGVPKRNSGPGQVNARRPRG